VAIALALRSRALLSSLTVLEAPVVELLRHRREDQRHYRGSREMTDRYYFAAFAAGDVAAIRLMIDFYVGPETSASWPRRVREYAMETTARLNRLQRHASTLPSPWRLDPPGADAMTQRHLVPFG
jgi:hypothetical protein